MTMAQTFHLPWPPTSNTMFGLSSSRRFPSERYVNWKNDAGKHLMMQRAKSIKGPVRVTIALRPPSKRKWDLDNRIKPLLDLLVSHLIIEDDNSEYVREVTVHVDPTIDPGAQVTVTKVAA